MDQTVSQIWDGVDQKLDHYCNTIAHEADRYIAELCEIKQELDQYMNSTGEDTFQRAEGIVQAMGKYDFTRNFPNIINYRTY